MSKYITNGPPCWGHITLLEVRMQPRMERNPLTDEEYVADTHGPVMLRLRCDCGHEWCLPERQFPGRRRLRWCGRAECPHNPARKPAKAPKEHGSAVCVYLPDSRVQAVRKWADEHALPFSRAVSELLNAGLLHKLLEEE